MPTAAGICPPKMDCLADAEGRQVAPLDADILQEIVRELHERGLDLHLHVRLGAEHLQDLLDLLVDAVHVIDHQPDAAQVHEPVGAFPVRVGGDHQAGDAAGAASSAASSAAACAAAAAAAAAAAPAACCRRRLPAGGGSRRCGPVIRAAGEDVDQLQTSLTPDRAAARTAAAGAAASAAACRRRRRRPSSAGAAAAARR